MYLPCVSIEVLYVQAPMEQTVIWKRALKKNSPRVAQSLKSHFCLNEILSSWDRKINLVLYVIWKQRIIKEFVYVKKYMYVRDVQGRRNYNTAHITDLNNKNKENVISKAYKKRTS